MEKYSQGEKIRNFRLKKGLSQLELEFRTNSSAGTISRIESGSVNPTKETLLKIIEALDLNRYEAASLFNIDVLEQFKNLLKISKELYNTSGLNKLLQHSVNEIVFALQLLGAAIYITEGNTLYSTVITQTWYTKLITDLVGTNLRRYSFSLAKDTESLLVKCVNDKKLQYSIYLKDFVVPTVSSAIADLVQKITGGKSFISLPLINGNEILGCIVFVKNYAYDFSAEIEVLESYCDNVSAAIAKVRSLD